MRSLRLVACAFLVAVLGAAAVVSGASAGKSSSSGAFPLRYGVVANVHYTAAHSDPGPLLDELRRGGVRSLREQFKWSLIEPERGDYDWARYDRLLEATARRGIHVVPLLFSNPDWAAEEWTSLPSPTRYARFVRAVADRYGPNGSFWRGDRRRLRRYAPRWFELLNEPYEPAFSDGDPDPARYARLVRAAGRAIHAADDDARVLAAVTHKTYDGEPWIDAMHDAVKGLGRYYDGIAQHPYSYAQDLDDRDNWFTRDMDRVRARMIANGGRSKPSFITEIGWATCRGEDERCMSEEAAAAKLTETMRRLRTKYRWVRAVHVYGYRDVEEDHSPTDSEDNYGLVRRDGTPKATLRAFTRAAKATR